MKTLILLSLFSATAFAEEISHPNCKLGIAYRITSESVLTLLKAKGYVVSPSAEPRADVGLGELVIDYQPVSERKSEIRSYSVRLEVKMNASTFKEVASVSNKGDNMKQAFLKTLEDIPKCKRMSR